ECGDYDEEALSLGAQIIRCPRTNPLTYPQALLRAMRDPAPYDVVHSHVHAYSGFVLWMAARAKVPVRIVHSHTDSHQQDITSTILRRMYLRAMSKLIHAHATAGFAVSTEAAVALFGPAWQADPRWSILPCGVDLRPFERSGPP